MPVSVKRTSIVAIALFLSTALTVRPALSQAVVLPAARTAGVPEFELLQNILERVKTAYPKDSISPYLRRTLNRFALAPFTQIELYRLYHAKSSQDTMKVLYGDSRQHPSIAYLRSVADQLRILDSTRRDSLVRDSSRIGASDVLAQDVEFSKRLTNLVGQIASNITAERRIAKQLEGPCSTFSDTPNELYDHVCAVSELETGELVQQPKLDARNNSSRLSALDSLSRVTRAVVIHRKITIRHFAPVLSREQALAFWRQEGFSTLNVGAVSGSGDQGAAFTELASPFLHAIRVSANSVLSASSTPKSSSAPTPPASSAAIVRGATAITTTVTGADSSDEKAINRFLNGGGLFNVGFAWPAYHWGQENGAADALVLLAPRFGATVPALGATQGDSALLYDGGLELHLKSSDIADGVGVFIQTRGSVAGGTRSFTRAMGIHQGSKQAFGYGTVSTGLVLGNRYLITASKTYAGPRKLRQLGWQVGVTAMRAAVIPGT